VITRRRGFRAKAGLMVVALLLLAACGSDKKSTSGGASGASSAPSGPSGTPIKLSVMATATGITGAPQVFDGVKAAVAAVNAAGGIKDPKGGAAHPLEVIECRVEGSVSTTLPQFALDCATKAINAGALADVGKYLFAQLAIPAFEKASVPLIGTFGVDQTDFTNPAVFELGGGGAIEVPGMASRMEQQGAKTLGFVSADNPAGRAFPAFIKPILKTASISIEQYAPLDPSADLTSLVSKLVQSNPDGVVFAETASISVRLTQLLRSAGYKGKIGISGVNLNDDTIKQLGANTNDIVSASNFPAVTDTSNAEIKKYNDEMDKYASGAAKDEFSLNAWYSVKVASLIMAKLTDLTPTAMLAGTKGFVVDTGLVPSFTLGQADNYLQFPTVPRATVYPLKIDKGHVAADGGVITLKPGG
jgi:ABC-type branched-subunit amino acid transport system substrate-binding protein